MASRKPKRPKKSEMDLSKLTYRDLKGLTLPTHSPAEPVLYNGKSIKSMKSLILRPPPVYWNGKQIKLTKSLVLRCPATQPDVGGLTQVFIPLKAKIVVLK
jgi:hypothetical protein